MSTLTTRAGKGSALTNNELDANFTNLNTDKVEKTGVDPVSITVASTSDALLITQTGTGNALVVEDSANPDSSPFVIDADGRIGNGLQPATGGWRYQQLTTNTALNSGGSKLTNIVNNLNSAWLSFNKARGAISAPTGVSIGDYLGGVSFQGYHGGTTNDYQTSAYIFAAADGTQGDGSSPGRLVFSTTENGASSPTERMRIRSDGNVGIGSTGTESASLYVGKDITGATTAYGIRSVSQIQPDVTSAVAMISSTVSTAASAFTLTNLRHFQTVQSTIGAGSVVTNQIGYLADSTLTGATNNYGFYGNIAAGAGRYNFYAAGTADNYFGGNLGIGTGSPSYKLTINTPDENHIRLENGGEIGIIRLLDSGILDIWSHGDANNEITFRNGSGAGSERMRIDSFGNLGIGTSSPSNKLQSAYTVLSSAPSAGAGGHGLAVGSSGFGLAAGALQSGNAYIQATRWDGSATNYSLILQPNGGNLGLGVTPKGWDAGWSAIDFGGNSIISGNSTMSVALNAYRAGTNWIYKNTAAASNYYQSSGVHYWYTAPSGTAGNAITFTQAMTLDASGNLRLGTTSAIASEKLTVTASTTAVYSAFQQSSGITAFYGVDDVGAFSGSYTNQPYVFRTNNTERMRIDSSGNVGIGTSSPMGKLDVTGSNGKLILTNGNTAGGMKISAFNAAGNANGYLAFEGYSSEYMRIDSSGNVGIGTSSPTASRLQLAGYNGGTTYPIRMTSSYSGVEWAFETGGSSSSGSFLAFRDLGNSAERMRIDSSGNLGLGVAPNAWNSGQIAFQFGSVGHVRGDTVTAEIGNNCYYNAGWKYQVSGQAATKYEQNYGAHSWFTAPSGTAGNAISFTQAMTLGATGNLSLDNSTSQVSVGAGVGRLYADSGAVFASSMTAVPFIFQTNNTERMRIDSSGNVGIGTSSPSARLDVWNASSAANAVQAILAHNPYDTNFRLSAYSGDHSGSASKQVSLKMEYGTSQNCAINFYRGGGSTNGFLTFDTNGTTEAMRIDSNGSVLVGATTSPDVYTKLYVATAGPNDVTGNFLLENTNTSTGAACNAQLMVKSKYGSSQMMQWDSVGVRIGTRYTANGGSGNVVFTSGSDAERMRIDSSGNVGIGTSAQVTKLQVNANFDASNAGSYPAVMTAGAFGGGFAVNDGSVLAGFYAQGTGTLLRLFAGKAPADTAVSKVAMTVSSAGTVILKDGLISTTGTGITFPATQSASSDANTLDDYEEGTWTPTVTAAGGGTPSYSYVTGYYTKIGNTVTASCHVVLANRGSLTGQVWVSGLPFAASSANNFYCGGIHSEGINLNAWQWAYIVFGDSRITFRYYVNNAGAGYIDASQLGGWDVMVNITYRV